MTVPDSSSPAKIGILDSGVGGLSVLRELHQRLPGVAMHYVGDSDWCPYGNKSPEEIRDRVTVIADYLLNHGANILVIACNSATIHAVGSLRANYPIPIVGMEPGVKPAAERTRSGVIGVLATEASIAGEKFHQLLNNHADGVTVITQPCPRFVELVEAGIVSGPDAEAAVSEALTPLIEADADVIVLGCTHYPFLGKVIEHLLPSSATIIDTGPAVADRVVSLISGVSEVHNNPSEILIETTGDLEHLDLVLPQLIPEIEVTTSKAAL